jgi:hypothetical protein
MAYAVTTGGSVKCTHQGTVALEAGQTKLTAGGKPVLGPLDLVGAAIAGCGQVGTGVTPCSQVTSVLTGTTTKLRVNHQPVLLDTATGVTNGVPPGTWSVQSAGQRQLEVG